MKNLKYKSVFVFMLTSIGCELFGANIFWVDLAEHTMDIYYGRGSSMKEAKKVMRKNGSKSGIPIRGDRKFGSETTGWTALVFGHNDEGIRIFGWSAGASTKKQAIEVALNAYKAEGGGEFEPYMRYGYVFYDDGKLPKFSEGRYQVDQILLHCDEHGNILMPK